MSAYGKVSQNISEDSMVETITQEFQTDSVVEKQVEKFDTTYSSDKLQELYAEYDKITIDEEKIKSLTQVKTNAISSAVPYRLVLGITTTAIISVLLVFLCIYNIFIINGMSSDINYLQGEVISYQESLVQSEGVYKELTDVSNIKNELKEMGYTDVTSSNIVTITVPNSTEVIELQGETNWFDSFCNFLGRVFG